MVSFHPSFEYTQFKWYLLYPYEQRHPHVATEGRESDHKEKVKTKSLYM